MSNSTSIPGISLFDIRNILTTTCAATRTQKELQIIYSFLSEKTNINKTNSVWNLLTFEQRLKLCAYFRYVKLDSNGELINLNQHSLTKDSKFFIIVKGTATLTNENHEAKRTSENKSDEPPKIKPCIPGDCFGSIYVNQNVRTFISGNANLSPSEFIQSDVQPIKWKKKDEYSVLSLPKDCHYIYLCSIEISHYIHKIVDDLVSSVALRRSHLELFCEKGKRQFKSFPRGHFISIEGLKPGRYCMLTLNGTAEIRKFLPCRCEEMIQLVNGDVSDESFTSKLDIDDTNSTCVSHAGPLSFLGFINHFLDPQNDENLVETDTNRNLFTIIANTDMRVMLLDADALIHTLEKSSMSGNDDSEQVLDCFRQLAKRTKDWSINIFPNICEQMDNLNISFKDAILLDDLNEFPSSNVADVEKLMQVLTQQRCTHMKKYNFLNKFKKQLAKDTTFNRLKLAKLSFRSEERLQAEKEHHLQPIPSIVRRESHGKTLPEIKTSCGYCDPYSSSCSKVPLS